MSTETLQKLKPAIVTNLFKDLELNLTDDFTILKDTAGKANIQFSNSKFRGKNGIVIFYNPDCPHCQNMQGDVIRLANMTKGLYPIGTINTKNTMFGNNLLADFMKVQYYPSIKFYDNGNFVDYNDGRDIKSFMKFLCVKNGLCDLS